MAVAQEPRLRVPLSLQRRVAGRDTWLAVTVAGVTFLLAYDQAGFGLSSRAVTAIVAWWAILLGLGLGVWPRARVPRSAWIVLGLLAAFAVWTFASIWWAKSAENAFVEFNRVAMYLGILAIAVLAGSRANLRRWPEGLAVGVVAIAMVALVSRSFPSTFSLQGFPVFLPGVITRLSFPLGYWNGLGVFVGFAYPLCLGLAVQATQWWSRALALAPLPLVAAVIYLTSSRGGVAVALVGTAAFIAVTAQRWIAFAALVVAAAGSAAAIAVLLPRHELVDGPVRSSEAAAQGHVAFVLILVISVAAGTVFAIGYRLLGPVRLPAGSGRVVLAILGVGLIAAVIASDPSQRFHTFKQLPGSGQQRDFVRTHLLSGSGNGRWQFWTAAAHEWTSAPVIGRGAGSYEAWWSQHASFSYFVRNAHSLYLEVLGELGLVGFLLLVGALVYGGVAAVRNTVRLENGDRIAAASLLGVLAAFYVAAAVEWVWQLTAVSAVALVCLGLLVGPAAASTRPHAVSLRAPYRQLRIPRFALGAGVLVVGWLLMCAQAIPWLTDLQIRASAAAVNRNEARPAVQHALNAKNLEPWASSPYLQLALVQEQMGNLESARKWIQNAIERDSADWRLWLVSARIETKAGNISEARQRLQHAASLNPRSPLFAGIS